MTMRAEWTPNPMLQTDFLNAAILEAYQCIGRAVAHAVVAFSSERPACTREEVDQFEDQLLKLALAGVAKCGPGCGIPVAEFQLSAVIERTFGPLLDGDSDNEAMA